MGCIRTDAAGFDQGALRRWRRTRMKLLLYTIDVYFLWNSRGNPRQFYASFQIGVMVLTGGRGRQNQLIREVTRRGAKNTFLSAEGAEERGEHLF